MSGHASFGGRELFIRGWHFNLDAASVNVVVVTVRRRINRFTGRHLHFEPEVCGGERAVREHEQLVVAYRRQTEELERSNRWAEALNQEVDERRARVTALQDELTDQQESARRMAEGYAAKVAELEEDIREKVQWAMNLKSAHERELAEAANALHNTEQELQERTAWALRLDEEKRHLKQQLAMVRASRWVRLGRKFGIGPGVPAA